MTSREDNDWDLSTVYSLWRFLCKRPNKWKFVWANLSEHLQCEVKHLAVVLLPLVHVTVSCSKLLVAREMEPPNNHFLSQPGTFSSQSGIIDRWMYANWGKKENHMKSPQKFILWGLRVTSLTIYWHDYIWSMSLLGPLWGHCLSFCSGDYFSRNHKGSNFVLTIWSQGPLIPCHLFLSKKLAQQKGIITLEDTVPTDTILSDKKVFVFLINIPKLLLNWTSTIPMTYFCMKASFCSISFRGLSHWCWSWDAALWEFWHCQDSKVTKQTIGILACCYVKNNKVVYLCLSGAIGLLTKKNTLS